MLRVKLFKITHFLIKNCLLEPLWILLAPPGSESPIFLSKMISGSLSGACWRLLSKNNLFSYQKWCPGASLDPAGASGFRMNDFPTRRPAEGSLAPGGCQRHRKTWKMQTLSVSQLVVRTIYVVCLSVMEPEASLHLLAQNDPFSSQK